MILLSYNKIKLINIYKFKKKINYILIFLILILVTKNFIRISEKYDAITLKSSAMATKYILRIKNLKKENIPIIIDGEIEYYYSSNGTCYFNTAPCLC